MLKEAETEETRIFVTFLSLVSFRFGGGGGGAWHSAPFPPLATLIVAGL